MSRIQKKCFIASTGFHLFLVVLLFVGPAFLSSNNKPDDTIVLTFVPSITTDEKIFGGGAPNGGTPPPAPTPQLRQPQAEPPKPAAQQKVEKQPAPEPEKSDSESLTPATKPKIKPNLNPTIRRSTGQIAKNSSTKAQPTEQNASKDLLAVSSTMKNLHSGLSTSTKIDMPAGPGGGGPSYANFQDAIAKVYYDAWIAPEGESAGDTRVEATVRIARGGEVLSARITKRSGNVAIDQSVQATLDRVRFAVPLPAGTGEPHRDVPIGFTARIKQGTG